MNAFVPYARRTLPSHNTSCSPVVASWPRVSIVPALYRSQTFIAKLQRFGQQAQETQGTDKGDGTGVTTPVTTGDTSETGLLHETISVEASEMPMSTSSTLASPAKPAGGLVLLRQLWQRQYESVISPLVAFLCMYEAKHGTRDGVAILDLARLFNDTVGAMVCNPMFPAGEEPPFLFLADVSAVVDALVLYDGIRRDTSGSNGPQVIYGPPDMFSFHTYVDEGVEMYETAVPEALLPYLETAGAAGDLRVALSLSGVSITFERQCATLARSYIRIGRVHFDDAVPFGRRRVAAERAVTALRADIVKLYSKYVGSARVTVLCTDGGVR